MKNYNLVIKIPIELDDGPEENDTMDLHKDIEDLFKTDYLELSKFVEYLLVQQKYSYTINLEKINGNQQSSGS